MAVKKRHILWNKNTPSVRILSQMNPADTFRPYFLNIHFNIILPSAPRISKWRTSFILWSIGPLLGKDLETNNETTVVAMQRRGEHVSTTIELMLDTVPAMWPVPTTGATQSVDRELSPTRETAKTSNLQCQTPPSGNG
jgi:hypothetical protein